MQVCIFLVGLQTIYITIKIILVSQIPVSGNITSKKQIILGDSNMIYYS